MCDDDIDKASSQHSVHTSTWLVATGNVFYTRHASTNPNHFSIVYYSPVDPSITVNNVTEVLNMIEGDKSKLTCALGIPKSQLEEILTDAERILASAKYYVNYHPEASWKLLTGELYYKKEFSAAMKSKSYMLTGNIKFYNAFIHVKVHYSAIVKFMSIANIRVHNISPCKYNTVYT